MLNDSNQNPQNDLNAQGQGPVQPSAQAQDQVPVPSVNVSGSPEAPVMAPVEQAPQKAESGYEKILEIEQQVESIEKREKQKQPLFRPKKKSKSVKESAEKKEIPPALQPKFFGYKPSKKLAGNPQMVKRQAGRGNSSDSKTWLLIFLDRLLKKENPTA